MEVSRQFSIRAGSSFRSAFQTFLLLLIGAYRTIGTTHLGGACRFEPSCSCYAAEALTIHTPIKAIKLITLRLLKCRPFGPCGFDPVPRDLTNQSGEAK